MNDAERDGRRAYKSAVVDSRRAERNLSLLQTGRVAGPPMTAEETRRYIYLVLVDLCETVSTARLKKAMAYARQRIAEDHSETTKGETPQR